VAEEEARYWRKKYRECFNDERAKEKMARHTENTNNGYNSDEAYSAPSWVEELDHKLVRLLYQPKLPQNSSNNTKKH